MISDGLPHPDTRATFQPARAREHDEMRGRVKTLEDRLTVIAGKMVVVSAVASTLRTIGATWIARQF